MGTVSTFDAVDAATSAERQQFVFDKMLEVIDLDFAFDDKDVARRTLVAGQDLFRNWNYAAWDSDDFKAILGQVEAFVAAKGRGAEQND